MSCPMSAPSPAPSVLAEKGDGTIPSFFRSTIPHLMFSAKKNPTNLSWFQVPVELSDRPAPVSGFWLNQPGVHHGGITVKIRS